MNRTQHHITFAFICIFLLSSYQSADAQQDIAQQAYAILETHCIDCHGEFGSYTDALVIEYNALITERAVIPRNPQASELYMRMLGDTDTGSQMPLGKDPLSAQSIAIIRRWIDAGAPDWELISKPKRQFITTEAMLQTIYKHTISLTEFDRQFARYFTLTHLYNAGARDDNLRAYRKALSKLVNSLSWGKRVKKPIPIDLEATIFYIDLRDYHWDYELDSKGDPWYKIQQAYPYNITFTASAYKSLCALTECEVPFVRADWFIANASLPPLYYNILDLPKTDKELETQLEVNVAANIKTAPGKRVWRAGFNKSGVSRNNRVVERHESQHGAYWKSYDFKGNAGKQNIFIHPLDFIHDGGEIIFNLPNGLQAYYLTTASGTRLDAAPIDIVSTRARDPVVRNGLSCMGCHTEGIKTFTDEVHLVIEQSLSPPYNKAQALRLYAEPKRMDTLIQEDIARYRRALETAGGVFGGSEPIQELVKQFEGTLDASHAAAEVGLETADFLQKIRENTTLQNAGLTVLGLPKGSVKRDAWTSQFRTVVSTLDIGKYNKPSNSQPVRTNLVVRPDPPKNEGVDKPLRTVPKKQETPPTAQRQEQIAKRSPSTSSRSAYAGMVFIPAGSFQMGSNSGDANEKPIHTVYVDAFYMDRYEVTNAQYKAFIDANPQWQKHRIPRKYHFGVYLNDWNGNNYPTGSGDDPVVTVSWYAAMAYAKWAGKRLPTEAEWEKAARSNTISYSGNRYGWSSALLEWCLGEYYPYSSAFSTQRNPVGGIASIQTILNGFLNIRKEKERVVRGSLHSSVKRITNRLSLYPGYASRQLSFRCVKPATP